VSIPTTITARPLGRSTLRGVRTVAGQEFRLRLRTGRWRLLLLAWFVALAGITAMLWQAADSVAGLRQRGVPIFGGLMIVLLSLSLLVVPALSGQSVNGDRERGVLATLQVTLLTPTEIALGKLAAAWGVSLVFLLLAVPMAVSTMFAGGVGVGRLIVSLLVLACLLGVVAAISQCWSALVQRTRLSTVLSNLSVFALTIGTLIAFGLVLPITRGTHTVTEQVPDETRMQAELQAGTFNPAEIPMITQTVTKTEVRTEKVWWLLAPNPYVILADAAPEKHQPFSLDASSGDQPAGTFDPLAGVANAVRDARQGSSTSNLSEPKGAGPVWPWGLGFDVLLGAGAVVITIRRLRTPSRRLPRGVRVA
jgi:ABC-type transport system involved in multi-copper enzyme maturation permease subunit